MDFLRLGVELEGADVEIDLVIRIRRRAIDPAGEPRVLETLRQPRAEERRQRFRPAGARKGGQRVRIAHEDVIAVEIGRRGRLADPDLRSQRARRRTASRRQDRTWSAAVRSRMPASASASAPRRRRISIGPRIIRLPCPPPSLPAVIFWQRRLRAEDELTWVALERAHHAINVVDRPPPLDGERLIFAQARIDEPAEAAANVLHPHVGVVGEFLDRQRRLADAVDRPLCAGRAKEALGGSSTRRRPCRPNC